MNAGASAIQGKKLSGERIANLEKMSECPALVKTLETNVSSFNVIQIYLNKITQFSFNTLRPNK